MHTEWTCEGCIGYPGRRWDNATFDDLESSRSEGDYPDVESENIQPLAPPLKHGDYFFDDGNVVLSVRLFLPQSLYTNLLAFLSGRRHIIQDSLVSSPEIFVTHFADFLRPTRFTGRCHNRVTCGSKRLRFISFDTLPHVSLSFFSVRSCVLISHHINLVTVVYSSQLLSMNGRRSSRLRSSGISTPSKFLQLIVCLPSHHRLNK